MFRWRATTKADVPEILRLVRALAEYERIPHEFTAIVADYERAFFGPAPEAEAMLCELEGRVVAVCVVARTFSTFAGKPGLWIEDIFVEPEHRRKGIARAAFAAVAQRAVAEGCAHLEWNVLDWNAPAIAAYEAMGAVPRNEWTDMRVSGPALARLAQGG
ncbi:GNAT family N-acetyltransferase [Sabulicella glaciei]|uniref:GNAT family N-acetyltransferase n=1 Tax=Sabulicella glaciei TaxID=2984948 RepID=A0ABT3NTC2_9PROT|nr:GNAT family N-acetyltransferase [Roseococcus sp. MDT2-1-1]MCW8085409.1 GNAT family N-acetyltransferase [Roseococcus sp. MDT2-1-1]